MQKTIYSAHSYNSWLGITSQELIQGIGTPTRIVPDENGGRIFIYDHSYSTTNTYSAPSYFGRSYGLATPSASGIGINRSYTPYYQQGNSQSIQKVITREIEFFINNKNIVYNWFTKGIPKTYTSTFKIKDIEEGRVDELLFLDPDKLQTPRSINCELGDSLYNAKDYDGAIKAFDTVIANNELCSNPNPYYLRGLAKYHIKDYTGATKDFTTSIALHQGISAEEKWIYENDRRESMYGIAMCYFKVGDTAMACIKYKIAVELKIKHDEGNLYKYCNK